MPIFYHQKIGRVLFIHVPKTGGSSIEKWLQRSGYRLRKLNFSSGDDNQHAHKEIYQTWGEFDYKFMVVRDPITRFISTLAFRNIDGLNAEPIARDIINKYSKQKGHVNIPDWGNHLRPQVDFLSEGVEVFKFEDNFFPQISRKLLIPGPFFHTNRSNSAVSTLHISDYVIDWIKETYKEDYITFGYNK